MNKERNAVPARWGHLRHFRSTRGHPTQGGFPSCALKGHQAPPFLHSPSSLLVPPPHPSESSPPPQSTRPGARAGGPSYMECCTSADSRPAPWAAPPSAGSPASSPAATAAGRGHSSSAPQLHLAPSFCRVRRATNLPVPTVPKARATLESPGRTFKNLHVRATLQMDHLRISGGGAQLSKFLFPRWLRCTDKAEGSHVSKSAIERPLEMGHPLPILHENHTKMKGKRSRSWVHSSCPAWSPSKGNSK